jgi:hypothetical protein
MGEIPVDFVIPEQPLDFGDLEVVVVHDGANLTIRTQPGAALLLRRDQAAALIESGQAAAVTLTTAERTARATVPVPDAQLVHRDGSTQPIHVVVNVPELPVPAVEVTNLIEAPRREITVERDAQGRIKSATVEDAA